MLLFWLSGLTALQFKSAGSAGPAGDARFTDTAIYYLAGKIACSPSRHLIYDPAVQLEEFNRLIAPAHSDKVYFCQSPPFFFVFMIPFALLPFQVYLIVWGFLSIVAGFGGLALLSRKIAGFTAMETTVLLLSTIVSFPAWIALLVGQTTWFVVALFSLFSWSLLKHRDTICGITIAATTFKPQYLPFLLIPALAAKRWKALATLAVTESLFLLLSGLVVGWKNVLEYPSILFQAESSPKFAGVWPQFMVSLRGFLSNFIGQSTVLMVAGGIMVLGILLVFWLWHSANNKGEQQARFAMSLTIVTALLASSHTHVYDLMLLAIPAVLTLKTSQTAQGDTLNTQPEHPARTPAKAAPACFALWSIILVGYPFISWLIVLLPGPFELHRYPFTVLNILLLALGLATRKPNSSPRPA